MQLSFISFAVFGKMESTYTIQFNIRPTTDAYTQKKKKKSAEEEHDGPVVERRCPVCKNDTMSYATLQLRSADEGQTVFYTCTKCKYVSSAISSHIFNYVKACVLIFSVSFTGIKRQKIHELVYSILLLKTFVYD